MQLSIQERLALLNVLPQQGDILTLRIVRDLQKECSFTEEEIERVAVRFSEDGKSVEWNSNADTGKEITIGAKATEVIKNAFERISEAGSMPIAYLSIYERFAPEDEQVAP